MCSDTDTRTMAAPHNPQNASVKTNISRKYLPILLKVIIQWWSESVYTVCFNEFCVNILFCYETTDALITLHMLRHLSSADVMSTIQLKVVFNLCDIEFGPLHQQLIYLHVLHRTCPDHLKHTSKPQRRWQVSTCLTRWTCKTNDALLKRPCPLAKWKRQIFQWQKYEWFFVVVRARIFFFQ